MHTNSRAAPPSRLLLSCVPHDEEVPEEERMWPDCAQGGAEEESSDRRLPGQELASERGFRVGRRMVSNGILSGDFWDLHLPQDREEEKMESTRFPAQ